MKNIDIFCGISSVGMPFPRENKNHIGYYDIVVNSLKRKGFNVGGFNMSRLDNNHTWDLDKNFDENRSIAYIKNLQIKSIENLRNVNKLFKLIIPKQYQKSFKLEKKDFKTTLRDLYIDSENPIFIYQGGVNDFYSFIKSGPVELLNKDVRNNVPKNIKELIRQCISNIEDNFETLYNLNHNTKVYALSFYYSPLYDKIQKLIYLQEKKKNKKYVNKFNKVLNLYNKMLKETCDKYEFVEYVDITFIRDYCAPLDFHPNTLGNKLIASKILTKMEFQDILSKHKTKKMKIN